MESAWRSPPLVRMQRGSVMPLALQSCPNLNNINKKAHSHSLSLPLSNSATINIQLKDEPSVYQDRNHYISTIPREPTAAKGPVTVNVPSLSTPLPRTPYSRSDSNSSNGSMEYRSSLVLFDPNNNKQQNTNNYQPPSNSYHGYTQVEVHPPPTLQIPPEPALQTPVPQAPPLPPQGQQQHQHQQQQGMFKNGVLFRSGQNSPNLQRSDSNTTSDPPSPTSPTTLISELRGKLRTTTDYDQDSVLMSSLDDSRSVTSYSTQSSGGNEADSACSVEEGSDGGLANDRIAITSEADVAVMIQARCESESTLESERFLDAVVDVARVCLHYYLRLESERGTMNGTQVNQLVMRDQRPVKEYLEEVSQDLADNLTIVRVVAQKVTSRLFVGTFVNEPVRSKSGVTVGKSGVVITLKKMNKISPACEFSDQLCHHIVYNRPDGLGKPERPRPERVSRKEKSRRSGSESGRSLLAQSFLYDPTITVTEAARRSFVEITDFVLYG